MSSSYDRIWGYIKNIKVWYLIAIVLLSGGLINFILSSKSVALGALVASSPLYQSLLETMALIVIVIMGLVSVLLMIRSSSVRSVRLSQIYFSVGLVLFIIWFVVVYEFWFKAGG